MAEQPHLDRVWDIIKLVGVCMLTTRFAGGLRARPLQSRPDRDAGVIWFVTDLRSAKEYEIVRERGTNDGTAYFGKHVFEQPCYQHLVLHQKNPAVGEGAIHASPTLLARGSG
jgi:hypothetical protein